MIIRAAKQLLRLSGISPIKKTEEPASPFPGDWYASQMTRFDGSYTAIHFLHNPTRISVLVPGTSPDSAIPVLRDRTTALLMRKGYGRLLFQFGLLSATEFFATNSRSMLASMNQMRYEIDYHLSMPETIKEINLDTIEDFQLEYLFTSGKKAMDFTSAGRILRDIMSKLS